MLFPCSLARATYEIFGYYDNVGGRNGSEDRSDGHIGRVCADTYYCVILQKIEISQEVWNYADVARENIERPL